MSMNSEELKEMSNEALTKAIFDQEAVAQKYELLVQYGDKSMKKDMKKAMKKLSKLREEQVSREAAIMANQAQKLLAERKAQRDQVKADAKDIESFTFDMIDDPVSRSMAWAALANGLQYQEISGEDWIEKCRYQMDTAMPGEQQIAKEMQFEEAKHRQYQVQLARELVHKEFEKAKAEIPEDSRANPQELYESDEVKRAKFSLNSLKSNLRNRERLDAEREKHRIYASLV